VGWEETEEEEESMKRKSEERWMELDGGPEGDAGLVLLERPRLING